MFGACVCVFVFVGSWNRDCEGEEMYVMNLCSEL